VLPYLELQKDSEQEENKKEQIKTPDLEGMTVEEAIKMLKEHNLDIQVENEPEEYNKTNTIVKEQLPKKEIHVYEGTKIIVKI